MPENKDYLTHEETLGTIQISEDVVASIATSTALEVEGVGGLLSTNMSDYLGGKKMTARGVRVEMEGDAIVVNLFIMRATASPWLRSPKRYRRPFFPRWRG